MVDYTRSMSKNKKNKILKYRDFNIKDSEDNKKKVDNFYEYLDICKNGDKNVYDLEKYFGDEKKFLQFIKKPKEYEQKIYMLENLMKMEYVKNTIEKSMDINLWKTSNNHDEAVFCEFLSYLYIGITLPDLYDNESAQGCILKAKKAFSICKNTIKFSELIVNHIHLNRKHYDAVVNKMLQLSKNDGFIPAFLTLCHLHSEMVNDDCSPIFNKTSDNYYVNYTLMDDIEFDEVFGPLFRKYKKYVV